MKNKKLKSKLELTITAAAVIAVAALINYASDKFFFRIDLTEDKQYTVSDATKRVLRGLDDIVVIKAFFSKDLPAETHNTVNTVRDLLSEYQNIAGGKLRVTWTDPAGAPEEAASAQALGVPEITLQTIKHDKAQAMKGYMGIGIMYADKTEAIPVVQNLQNLEYDLTQAIMRVKRDKPPKIGVLKAQGADFVPEQIRNQMNMSQETTERLFSPIFDNLRRDYEVVTVDPSEGAQIDADIRTLIIPGGERFTDRVIFEIDQYFMNGGNLLVLGGAVNVSFRQGPQAHVRETKLLELLEHYGVRVERNMIMDASCGHVQVPRNIGPFTINDLMPYPYFVRIVGDGFSNDNPVTSSQSELMLGWASSLTLVTDSAAGAGKVSAIPLAMSSNQSWEVTGTFDITPQPQYNVPPQDVMRPHTMAAYLSGEFKSFFEDKPIPSVRQRNDGDDEEDASDPMSQINLTGAASDKDRSVTPSNAGGNLVVIGDANFISASNASRPNIIFLLNLADWLTLDNNLITIRSRAIRDKTINPNVLEEGSSVPGLIRWINLLLMPLIVTAAGIFISLKRREKTAPAPAPVTSTAAKETQSEK